MAFLTTLRVLGYILGILGYVVSALFRYDSLGTTRRAAHRPLYGHGRTLYGD
jgi:hypothetical protein